MLLNRYQITKLIAQGVVENAPLELLNPASLDLTLGPELLEEAAMGEDVVEIGKTTPTFQKVRIPERGYFLRPGEFVLAASEQIFHLPNNVSTQFNMKSSCGRCGLTHMMAGWCDAGWNNSVLTIELGNALHYHTILLKPGMRIGQMVFFQHDPLRPEHLYKGRYNNDRTVQQARPEKPLFIGETLHPSGEVAERRKYYRDGSSEIDDEPPTLRDTGFDDPPTLR